MKIKLDIACQNFLIPYIIRAWPKYKEAKHLMLIAKHLQAVEKGEIKRLIIAMPPRHGKQIADSTPILTTKGWTTHGKLKIGDKVFSPSGYPVKVVGIGLPSKEKMRVTFTDNNFIDCHPDHEWTVFDRSRASELRTIETKYIHSQILYSGDRARFQLPFIAPLKCEEKELKVDPYTLGAWLGDGKSDAALICGSENDLKHISDKIPYEKKRCYKQESTNVHYVLFDKKLRYDLKEIDVWKNKHIPEIYKISSEKQRRELLEGLVDTDGSVNKDGRVRFVGCNERLVRDVQFIARSLGYRCNIQKRIAKERNRKIRDVQDVWIADWTPHDGKGQGTLPRKINPRIFKPRKLGIKSIDFIPDELGRCIQVENEDGLYLVGNSLIPTHNSLTLSEYFPAWYLGRNPTHQVIFSTYGQKLASGFGRKVRNQMNDPIFRHLFPKCKISPDSKSKNEFTTTEGGVYIAVGRGGSLTGKGANLAILDDLIKDQEEAQSEAVREGLKDWYEATLSTRMQPNGAIIINATRWHEDDLTGWVQKRFKKEGWVKLILPALDENDNALWPEMWPSEELKKIRESKSPYWWSALYQQSPTPKGGNIFKKHWFNFYDILPHDAKIHLQSWDLSFKAGPDNSYVVGQVWAKRGAQKYLVHQFRKQIGFNDTEKEIIRMTLNFPLAKRKLIEDKANGPAIMNSLGRKISGLIPVDPKGASKESRWLAAAEIVESGNVFIPNPVNNPWVEEYLNEMTMVPNSAFNDQADATAQAILDMEDENLNALDSFLNM